MMKIRVLIVLILICQVCFGVKFKSYTSKNFIYDICIHNDTVWLATTGGVMKRDINGNILASYTRDDGLMDNVVMAVAVDSIGNKWFATNFGVSRFDGTRWKTYDSTNGVLFRPIRDFFMDNKGNKWIAYMGIGGGDKPVLTKFDDNSWTHYDTSDGLPRNEVVVISQDKDENMWFGAAQGVCRYDGSNWVTYDTSDGYPFSGYTYDIAVDSTGDIWFAGDSWGGGLKGLCKFDGINWTHYPEIDSLLISSANMKIAADNEGNIWFYCPVMSSPYDLLGKFDGTNLTVFDSTNSSLPKYATPFSIAIDHNNHKWLGASRGLCKYNGTDWNTFSYGLNDLKVKSVAIDGEGNKWFASFFGVSKFDGINWTTYDYTDYDSLMGIYSIAVDNTGDIWVGTSYGYGIFKYNGVTWQKMYKDSNFIQVHSAAVDKDNSKWFGGELYGGVRKFNGTNWTAYTSDSSGLASNRITCIAIDSNDIKWFGCEMSGVSKFNDTSWVTYTTTDGLVDNYVTDIAVDSDNNKWFVYWWVGEYGPRITKYDNNIWTTYSDSIYRIGYINCIAIDKNNVKWIGGQNGLYKFDGTDWTVYKKSDGLVHDSVTSIVVDNENNKWITTRAGVSLLIDSSTSIKHQANVSQNPFYSLSIRPSGKALLINYKTNIHGNVTFSFYNLQGKCIHQISEKKAKGEHCLTVNTSGMSSGSYICRLTAPGGISAYRKVVIVR